MNGKKKGDKSSEERLIFAAKPLRFSSKTNEVFALSFCPLCTVRTLLVRRPEVVRPIPASSDGSKPSDEYARPASPLFFNVPVFSPPALPQYAQDCTPARYDTLLRQAKQAADKGRYDLAINKLQSAKTCLPEKEKEVNREILNVFKEVNNQKNIAEEQKNLVMISARTSHNATLAFQTRKTNATLALGISEYNYRRHPNESMAKADLPSKNGYQSKVERPMAARRKTHPRRTPPH